VLRLGRENDIPLMQSLSQLSYNSAKPLGDMGLKAMQDRGRMQVGKVADITIFDPENVADTATYAKGAQPSTGIPYVLVNGTVVVSDSKVLKDVNPGQPIRFEPETTSRFEPVSVDAWNDLYMVSPVEFGGTEPFGRHGLDCC
jgi:N-acyl-D-aspartate/D-glutamate deacylase